MTYEAIVKKVKTAYSKKDASKVQEHLAIQFNVTGEGEGALYLEIANGKLVVEPYDYYDRDVLITSSAKDLIAVAEGKTDFESAIKAGTVYAQGNVSKLALLNELVAVEKKAPAKKAAAKKAPAKKETHAKKEAPAKKETTVKNETTVKKEEPAKKETAKMVATPKTVAPKATEKKTTK